MDQLSVSPLMGQRILKIKVMKGKEILLIAISSFLLTVIWIVSNVYHANATSTIDSLLQVQIIPISPDFDQDTIGKIKQRTTILPVSSATVQISTTPTPTPSLTVSQPTPTEEILPSEIPLPTEILISPSPEEATPTP